MGDRSGETKQLARLLRHLGGVTATVEPDDDGRILVSGRNDGGRRSFAAPVLRRAVSLGLVREGKGTISVTAAASAFLKRALVEEPGEAFLEQQRAMAPAKVEINGAWKKTFVNLQCHPLNLIARLKDRSGEPFLPPEAVRAGERLHADFTTGQLQPRIVASWEPRLSSRGSGGRNGAADISDSAAAARQRVARALSSIDPELAGVALDVCCFMKGLETIEFERRWPARSAKVILRLALLALSRHYDPERKRTRTDLRHWGEEGYRPRIG
ncbi:DUF6456 domain-containing protein [Rhizobiaceae bacterium n13]|uniref:DUF6456 domain-containing protein n=1 Tax=Ferirhizobium litorale TaxID=2927786 RepID=A0AAE3QCK4_9HYPH|nr:DUF6456 domain-containing protein [Fererhizobium litorale]MDI7861288.1 DUF6456 domain-containing protein [Fererhizobium litorale]MDI7921435.1 DUF6456 domain-containing protein [Fererhizobium litorale]